MLAPRVERTLPRLAERLAGSPQGAQLGAQTGLLAAAARRGDARLVSAMARTILEMLDVFAAPETPDIAPARIDALRAYARTRLSDPGFTLDRLAAAFACTPRTVQAAFAADGDTFSGWVRAERLDRAREQLRHAGDLGRPLSAVARDNGFADVGTFHRAYRARFGATPARDR
jgi:AraC-like DNA-binding protein